MANSKESVTKLNDADYRLARAYRLIEEIARRVRAEEEKQRKILANILQTPNTDGIVLAGKVANCESENHEENSEHSSEVELGV